VNCAQSRTGFSVCGAHEGSYGAQGCLVQTPAFVGRGREKPRPQHPFVACDSLYAWKPSQYGGHFFCTTQIIQPGGCVEINSDAQVCAFQTSLLWNDLSSENTAKWFGYRVFPPVLRFSDDAAWFRVDRIRVRFGSAIENPCVFAGA